jgi:fumarate reductase subunit D
MMRAAHKQPGFLAAQLHRLSGIALAIFLPFHFLALGLALEGANALDSFLQVTTAPLVELSEAALAAALCLHMALGLRVLAIEFLGFRERTVSAVSLCAGAAIAILAAFFLSAS